MAVGLDSDFFAEGEVRGRVFGVVAVGLALLRAVNPAEADACRMVVM